MLAIKLLGGVRATVFASLLVITALFATLKNYQYEKCKASTTKDKLDTIIAQVEESNKAAARLQKKLDSLPKSEGTIREIVREYPAPCPMPKPVHDGLRQAIDKANASRKVPSDS